MFCELVKVLDEIVKELHVNYDEVFPLSLCIMEFQCSCATVRCLHLPAWLKQKRSVWQMGKEKGKRKSEVTGVELWKVLKFQLSTITTLKQKHLLVDFQI